MGERMFEAIELNQKLSKSQYKQEEQHFRSELLKIQRELRKENIATLIIVAGMEGSGKGHVVDNLNKWFDNRGIETHAFWDETDEETQRPEYWRFWKRLPARSKMAIMFGGWYWGPIYQYAEGVINDNALVEKAQRIKAFENMLAEDGLVIVKLWFHLPKKVFKKHIVHRSAANMHVATSLHSESVSKHFKKFTVSAEKMIRYTNTAELPWHLIEASDANYRDASVGRALLSSLQQHLHERRVYDRRSLEPGPNIENTEQLLDQVDLTLQLAQEEHKKQLKAYQAKLNELAWRAYGAKRSAVIVFEGWDAAGKGGAIRRLTNAMDARLYRSISVAAPTDEELAHHYLWRFWRQLPRAGYMTLYDRSWYGRVLVERVEGLAMAHEWQRAYQEINGFEEQLIESGVTVIKFWMHISPEEQLKRFEQRKATPWKQHKLTEEDWRNRDKWQAYTQAVNDMVLHTSIDKAPWHIVAANDKYLARVNVIKTVCERLAHALSK